MKHAVIHLREEHRFLMAQLAALEKAQKRAQLDVTRLETAELIEQTRREINDVADAILLLETTMAQQAKAAE